MKESMKGHVDTIKKEVEGTLDEATRGLRRELYRKVGQLEEDAALGKGVPGAVKETLERAKGYHTRVKQEGGYKAKVRGAIDRAAKTMDETADSIGLRVENAFDAMEQTGDAINARIDNLFYTDGEFDNDKLDAYLRTQGEALKHAGGRALETVGGLVDRLKQDYRNHIPSADEKTTTYEGIGKKHPDPRSLFREDYDACLGFYNTARKTLPGGLRLRGVILQDIWESASGNPAQLANYYSQQKNARGQIKPTAQAKLEVIGKYKL